MTASATIAGPGGGSKAGGICGILAGVFFIATFAVAYNFPFSSSDADKALSGFSSMQASYAAGGVSIGLAAIFAIPFFLALRHALRGKDELWAQSAAIFSVVGIVVTALTFIGEVLALFVLKDAYAQAGTSRTAAVVVAQVIIGLGAVTVGVFFLAVGVGVYGFAMTRSSRFPHWLGYVGILAGALLVAGFLPIPGAFFVLGIVAFLLLIVWILATGALLWRPTSSMAAS